MKEQLSKVSGWIARPVAILALLIGVGAIGAALALAIDGGGSDEPTRFQQLAERTEAGGEESQKNDGDGEPRHEDGEGEEPRQKEGGDAEGFHGGFGEGFDGLPEEFGQLREQLESFGNCLQDEGVELPGKFGFGFGLDGGSGPGGFSRGGDEAGASFEPVHFRGEGVPGFGRGGFGFGSGGDGEGRGNFDFDALREGFEACSDQLPDGLEEPFNNRQERFDERQQNRGAFEDCLQEQGIGPGDRPGRGDVPDEADFDRLRGAFEECRDQLGESSDGASG